MKNIPMTEGEAALLLCILGVKKGSTTIYPTVEESLRYMDTGIMDFEGYSESERLENESGKQLSIFL